MLEQILRYLRNWFVVSIHTGEFTVGNGNSDFDFLMPGQYYRIVGSVFNDGVYCYKSEGFLQEETFRGSVWALAVPGLILDLAKEIEEWEEKNAAIVNSPYQSESFGGYSYTIKSAGRAGDATDVSWQSVFSKRLNAWRKL